MFWNEFKWTLMKISVLTDYFPADFVWLNRNTLLADSTRQPDKERKCLHFLLSAVVCSRVLSISNYIHNSVVKSEQLNLSTHLWFFELFLNTYRPFPLLFLGTWYSMNLVHTISGTVGSKREPFKIWKERNVI